MGPLLAIPALLAERGVDLREILAEGSLPAATFDDPDHTLPFAAAAALLDRCARRTGCEHFALLAGQRFDPSQLGELGYLSTSAATVGEALASLTGHLHVQDRGAVASLRVENGFATLSYAIVGSGPAHAGHAYPLVMAIACRLMKALCGPDWRPTEVTFALATPQKVDAYRACFGVTPRFDEAETAIVFPASTLRRPLPAADATLHALMRRRVEANGDGAASGAVEEVRRWLRAMMAAGDACSLAEVARRVGMHERSLKRRLAQEGATFRALREEARFEAACELLANTRVPVGEIAGVVGYSDPSAFTHAFRRRAGISPARWRATNAPGEAGG